MSAGRNYTVQREYVYGNTVRKQQYQTVPEKRVEINHNVRRNQERALYMNLPYVVVLTIAVLCALYICVNYLQMQSSISAHIYNIETLEKQLEQLKSENDALETSINTYVDLDHVYQVATQELGMVYANKNQVLLYDKTESEYVRQYEDIPGK